MCGITGILSRTRSSETSQIIQNARNCLSHRGPDDRGIEKIISEDAILYLAHTRLSIIDLSKMGHQPMNSENGRYTITFNGEIYNYKELRKELRGYGRTFDTETDTEVLVQAWNQWGKDCLKRLTGMFAFTIYDRKDKILTAARDAFGIKPFYYYFDSSIFSFASEIPSLLQLLPSLPAYNIQSCYNYLMFGTYDRGEETFFENVNQLLPGHFLQLDLKLNSNEPTVTRWWWPPINKNESISFEQAAKELRKRFLENVQLHLRSDVPLGAALSGGIDSSAVVCAMRKISPDMPIHTFSYIARGSDVDEEKWVDLVNNHIGAIPHKIEFTPDELISDLDDLIKTQGEPFSSTSIYAQYQVFKKVRDEGITVTLDGQGADELLAGYNGYPISRFKSLIEAGEFKQLITLVKNWKSVHNSSSGQVIKYLRSALVDDQLRDLADKLGRRPTVDWLDYDFLNVHDITLNHRPSPRSNTGRERRLVETLRNELTNQSLQSLLRHADRNSMRWSIESRVPFLTNGFAEYILSLPEHFLLSNGGETKHVFRAAMRGIVPDEILDRQDKIGFRTPEKEILHALKDILPESLNSLGGIPFIKIDQLKIELNNVLYRNQKSQLRIWNLFNLSRFISIAKENY